MTVQLRIYTINRGQLEEFTEVWRRAVVPLRRSLGFMVMGSWIVPESNQFVWVLGYEGDGGKTFEEADRAYYESPERRLMDPDPGRWIARTELSFVQPAAPN
jgi:hypothetical protein